MIGYRTALLPCIADKLFNAALQARRLPRPVREFVFAAPRKWRFDYAWPAERLALEVEGGVWTQGRHTRGAGFLKDMEKYNEAAARGWRVIRTTPDALLGLTTFNLIERALA